MRILVSILLFVYATVKADAQQSLFKLTLENKESFYDKGVVTNINKELSRFKRNVYDTAFVYIDDSHGNLIDSYIAVKNKNELRIFYLLFITYKKKYYIAELNASKVKLGSIYKIYRLVNDTNFNKKDTLISIPDDYRCNLYFGINKRDKELWVWGSDFGKDTSNLMSYITGLNGYIINRDSYELSYYFATEDFTDKTKLPSIVQRYRVMKYAVIK